MLRSLSALILVLTAMRPALAEPPRVVADIAPVHALVATVMDGVALPDLLVPASSSAHAMALRPSQMRALQEADLVIWIGPELTQWLDRALDSANAGAGQIALLDLPGTRLLPYREDALFSHDDHAHEDKAHEEDAHEEDAHADEAHEEDTHEDEAHEEDAHENHEGIDPHAWLDPVNASLWMTAIAERLAQIDPAHADLYRANAKAGAADLNALTLRIASDLEPAQDVGMIAFHDAFQYFEARFGLELVGAISEGDAADPGPARIAALRDAVRDGQVRCAFAEPQFNPGLLKALAEDGSLTVAVLDPLGATHEPGPGLYKAILTDMAATIASCASN